MSMAFIQDFKCETIEGRDRYAEIVISCRIVVDAFGIVIDAVKQTEISRAIRAAVEKAVAIEGRAEGGAK